MNALPLDFHALCAEARRLDSTISVRLQSGALLTGWIAGWNSQMVLLVNEIGRAVSARVDEIASWEIIA